MINFFCKCGQPMSVRPEFVGRTGQCPRCKQPITVPPQSQQRPPAPPPAPPAGPTQPWDRGRIPPPQPHQQAPQPPTSPRGARLEVIHGPAGVQGKVFNLDGRRPALIGRDPNVEVSIPSDRVSRRHCQLEPKGDGSYTVADMGSSNGTLVNQVRLTGPQVLRGGEYIQTGDCLFRFVTA